jgi:hypothetical protein
MCRDLLNDKAMRAFLSLNLIVKNAVCKFYNHEANKEFVTGNNTIEQLPI